MIFFDATNTHASLLQLTLHQYVIVTCLDLTMQAWQKNFHIVFQETIGTYTQQGITIAISEHFGKVSGKTTMNQRLSGQSHCFHTVLRILYIDKHGLVVQ